MCTWQFFRWTLAASVAWSLSQNSTRCTLDNKMANEDVYSISSDACADKMAMSFQCVNQSRSQSFVPLDQQSENENSGSIHFQITMEITEFCISGLTAHACAVRSLHVWYLYRMPEMDAPRALVFRPLVKVNEALGTRLFVNAIYYICKTRV